MVGFVGLGWLFRCIGSDGRMCRGNLVWLSFGICLVVWIFVFLYCGDKCKEDWFFVVRLIFCLYDWMWGLIYLLWFRLVSCLCYVGFKMVLLWCLVICNFFWGMDFEYFKKFGY